MIKSVKVTPKAEMDLLTIWSYIADNNIEAADRIVDTIEESFVNISLHPHIGRRSVHYPEEMRYVVVGKHLVIYGVTDEDVLIYRIVHSSRDISNQL